MISITRFKLTQKQLSLQEDDIMLETSQERVKLLKEGISIKTIERLYLKSNSLKIIGNPILYDAITAFQIADFSEAHQ